MKKRLTLLVSALLCAFALVLTACGGGAAEKVDPSAKFIGSWKLAAAEVQGVTVAGDIGMIVDGAEDGIYLNISEGGTCTLTAGEETADAKWELTDDNTITLTVTKSEDSDSQIVSENKPAPIKYKDGALVLEVENDDMSGAMIFTADGTWEGATIVASDSLKEISDSKDLVGEWKLVGVTMQGICMYGSAEDLSAFVPSGNDTSLTINEDGSAKAMGQDVKWAIEDGAAKLDVTGTKLPLRAYDGGIALDMSDVYGTELLLLYSK